MLTILIYFAHFKCIERLVRLSTHLQPGFFFGGGEVCVFLQEKSHRTGRLRTERMVHCSVSDISLRMAVDSFGWQLTQLRGSAVSVFRRTREERRPPFENTHSLLSTCRWQASRRRQRRLYERGRITVDFISPASEFVTLARWATLSRSF